MSRCGESSSGSERSHRKRVVAVNQPLSEVSAASGCYADEAPAAAGALPVRDAVADVVDAELG